MMSPGERSIFSASSSTVTPWGTCTGPPAGAAAAGASSPTGGLSGSGAAGSCLEASLVADP
jgi:hypothetical protein